MYTTSKRNDFPHNKTVTYQTISDNRAAQLEGLWSGYVRGIWHHLRVAERSDVPRYDLERADQMLCALTTVITARRTELRLHDRRSFYRLCSYSDQATRAAAQVAFTLTRAARYYEPSNPATFTDIQDVKREMPTLAQTAEVASLLCYDACLTAWLQGLPVSAG